MNIQTAETREAQQIARLHKQEIHQGFLSSLPVSFLQRLYEDIIRSDVGFCIVAEENGRVVGFVAGTTSLPAFFRYFLSHSFLYAGVVLLPKVFSIRSLQKIFEILLYPSREDKLPPAELLTIATAKEFQGQGIGSRLLLRFIEEMRKRGIEVFKVMVGKELGPVVKFYRKAGFEFFLDASVHNSQPSFILTYHIKQH